MLRPSVGRQIDDDGSMRAPHHNPREWFEVGWVDFHMRQERRDMDEIASLGARRMFSVDAPPDQANAG
ncbi:hypothetical protein AGQ48_24465 [Salmonella enterica subsp. enterica]|nr:hypothetical protein AGQ48_24465 [Salmonella enterica subsp. enterica]